MKQSALEWPEQSSLVEPPPVQPATGSAQENIIAYPGVERVPRAVAKKFSTRNQKRHRKLMLFIKLEAAALFLLVLSLSAATTKSMLDLAWLFQVGVIFSALMVTIIPVIFYGWPRHQYRYRSRRRSVEN